MITFVDEGYEPAGYEPAAYDPVMPAERVERIRRWHERTYAERRAAGAGTFDYLGRTIVVPAEVQPIYPVSHLLGDAVLAEVRPTDRVLDMGTGSGVNAILAAATAASVLAVDINPHALAAAKANAERNGVADRVEVRYSDVFGEIHPDTDGVFDLIVFDPPFRWFRPRDLAEAASTDENYRALRAFFGAVRDHLAPGGRVLLFFGTSGDLDHLRSLIDRQGFACATVASESLVRDGETVEYFTYRLTL